MAVIVLHVGDFVSIEAMLAARGAVAATVMFRIRRAELDQILPAMQDGDDVCFIDDPPALVEHRMRLLAREPHARSATEGRDGLTGLWHRAAFLTTTQGALPAALLLVNLDRFKMCNDQHGHLVGDAVLRAAAERTRAAAPADAVVARIAGDTFAIALSPHHDARRTAAAVRAAFHAAPCHDDIAVTVSIGMVRGTDERTIEELLQRAEGSLYSAKARGRDRVVEYAEREREARERDGDVELDGFEEMTRVLAQRVADVIAWRGRRVFQGLRDQADVDALTGLYTRRYLDRRLAFEIQAAHEAGTPLSLGLLDVDHFGAVNKEHGWPTGDRVLADATARVRDALRQSDWAARYGGEEICVVLPAAELAAARGALERVAAAMRDVPFLTTQDEPLAVTVSIGCVQLHAGESLAELVERVSARLLEAKRGGRDRVCS